MNYKLRKILIFTTIWGISFVTAGVPVTTTNAKPSSPLEGDGSSKLESPPTSTTIRPCEQKPPCGHKSPCTQSQPCGQKPSCEQKPPCGCHQNQCGSVFSHFYGYFNWCAEFYKWVEKYGKWMANGVNCMFH